MRVCVVDADSGNLASAARALAEAASRANLQATIEITADPDAIRQADRIVLPGQGAFATVAAGLAAVPGLRQAIIARTNEGAPFLGICVGMQLMAERGLEHSITPGLGTPGFGWITGEIAPLPAPGLRLPHMGWNALAFTAGAHPLLDSVAPGDHVYFVHSYGLQHYAASQIAATTDYGGAVPALVALGNRAGTQFHVEKSQEVGLRILANFLRWVPQTSPNQASPNQASPNQASPNQASPA
jgi:glutamine amidotransferase